MWAQHVVLLLFSYLLLGSYYFLAVVGANGSSSVGSSSSSSSSRRRRRPSSGNVQRVGSSRAFRPAAPQMDVDYARRAAGPLPASSCAHPWSGPKVTIGKAADSWRRLIINGQAIVPMWVKVGGEDPLEGGGPNRWDAVRFTLQQAAKVGALPIVSFSTDRLVRNSSAVEGGTDWQFNQARPLDNRTEDLFQRILSYAPDALLFPTIYPWFGHHDNGACVVSGRACQQIVMQDSTNASHSRISFPNVPSAQWAAQVAQQLAGLLCYLDARFPRKLFGVQLNGIETGEWFLPGMGGHSDPSMFADYSETTRQTWCSRVENGDSDGAAPCTLPSSARRDTPTIGNTLRSGSTPNTTMAFNRFLSTRTVSALASVAAAAKQISGDNAFVGFYYGYLYELAGRRLAGSGHLALTELMREPSIDAILSPYAYSADSRECKVN
jgi:hypothetical protein